MVKAYLRYEPANKFGVIASSANVVYSADGKFLYTSALEDVAVWNVKQGSLAGLFSPTTPSTSTSTAAAPEVTQLALSPSGSQLAAGYADGSVRLWDTASGACAVTLQGHKSAVSALRYSTAGDLLASGGRDTDVIVWDVVGEAGLYRLRGHKDQVTDLVFLPAHGKLVTSSKDGSLRVWDLAGQRCSQVVTGFKAEVWSLDANAGTTRLVAGGVETDVQVYAISPPPSDTNAASTSGGQHEVLSPTGGLRRSAQERVALLRFDGRSAQLGCLSGGKTLEIFRVLSEEVARKKQKRRKKRKAEKQAAKRNKAARGNGADAVPPTEAAAEGHSSEEEAEVHEGVGGAAQGDVPAAADEFTAAQVIVNKHKVRSFAFAPAPAARPGGTLGQVAISLANNSIEVLTLKAEGWDTAQQLQQAGHRSDVRCLALSTDDALLFSASSAGAKLWNPATGACLGTMDCGYGLCAVFAPGNKHVVVGTKEGTLELFDLGAATRVHVEQAHQGAVWSLALLPDKSGFVSGSADKTVKVWTWTVTAVPVEAPSVTAAAGEGVTGDKPKGKKAKRAAAEAAAAAAAAPPVTKKVLGVTCTRQLEMAEDVLCVRVSPDGRLLAVALLDSTIKVYYLDTFKFFLSLYGHKLPVLCMDISSDSTLLISGSADKNIKVWGLDFGDCHRSLFAHQDTVTSLAFVRDTHYAFSTGKDGLVKYWDLDRWEMLLELPGHHAPVWALGVSAYGDFVVTGSQDRSLRRWQRTNEPFFVEEEKEKRLESLFESDLQQEAGREEATKKDQMDQQAGAAAPAGRKTLETVAAADALVDALDMAAHEEEKQEEHERAVAAVGPGQAPPPAPLPNPLLLGLDPSSYVLRSLGAIKAAELEQALLLLSFSDALRLLRYLADWCKQRAQAELCCRVAVLLLRLHHGALTSTPSARPTLLALHAQLRPALQALKDTLGFNCAALKYLQRSAKEGSVGADSVLAAPGGGAALAAARQMLRGEA